MDRQIELPEPDQASQLHSARVCDFISNKISESGGSISFAEYMQHALYSPGLGYYAAGASKFGEEGDFVTAPEVSRLFGRVVARQIAGVLKQIRGGSIFEPGAGSGVMAVQIMRALSDLGALPESYRILEVSADLRQRQEARIRKELPDLADRVSWLSAPPENFDGVIVVNEVADSLPVEKFAISGDAVKQFRVAESANGFEWQLTDAPDRVTEYVRRIELDLGAALPDGFVSEFSPGLASWLAEITAGLGNGAIFLFDYGLPRREYYGIEHEKGWLRCHFRHRAHNDPLMHPGIQDITAWIDFSVVAEAAADNEFDVAGFVNQAQFLINGGLREEMADFDGLPADEQMELSREIKLLTLPGEMGEHFKCIGLSRGDIELPTAFAVMDRAHTL